MDRHEDFKFIPTIDLKIGDIITYNGFYPKTKRVKTFENPASDNQVIINGSLRFKKSEFIEVLINPHLLIKTER